MSNLESRYGRSAKPTPKWFWPVIAAIGVSLGVAWAAWSAASNDRPWQAEVYGYEVIDDKQTIGCALSIANDVGIASEFTRVRSVASELGIELPLAVSEVGRDVRDLSDALSLGAKRSFGV